MTPENIFLRQAGEADLPQIQAIYAHYVLHSAATFEESPPGAEETARRWRAVSGLGLPYLVAGFANRVQGFAYAAPYRERPGYRHTVEDSVYVSPDALGRGLGGRLLADLIERCAQRRPGLDLRQMIALIGDSGNTASISLHEKNGFSHAGLLKSAGFKLGRWVDVVMMQRALSEGDSTLPREK